MTDNIVYTYKDCSRDDFAHDTSFNEEEFNASLAKCFETQLKIDRIEVDFALESHEENRRLVCGIRVASPDLTFQTSETGFNKYAEVVNAAIRTTVDYVMKEKEKKTDH